MIVAERLNPTHVSTPCHLLGVQLDMNPYCDDLFPRWKKRKRHP
jgi:hypothetical protein